MDKHRVEYAILRTIWREIDHSVEKNLHGVREGRGQFVNNPFTGQETEMSAPAASLMLREKLEQSGALNSGVLDALRAVIRDAAASAAFAVLSAVDYEGAFEDGVQIEISDTDGNKLDHCFHELFDSADPEQA